MAQTWVTVRVDDVFAKELSLLAKAEGYEDRSKFLRYVLQSYLDENLFIALQGHLDRIGRERAGRVMDWKSMPVLPKREES